MTADAAPAALTVRLLADDELPGALPVARHLDPALPDATRAAYLPEMLAQGYRCAAVFDGDAVVGLCGLWETTRFYCGRQIEVDNVVVLPDYRSRGVGRVLMAWVYAYARERGCQTVELNAYTGNLRAHAFYEADGFVKIGYHMQKRLDAPPSP